MLSSKVAVVWGLAGHGSVCGSWREIVFASPPFPRTVFISTHGPSRFCSYSLPCPIGEGVGVSKQLCGCLAAGQGKPATGVLEYRLVFLASNNILQNEDTS